MSPTRFLISASSSFLLRGPKAMLSATDMCGNSAYCWNTVFTLRLYGGTADTSAPSSRTRPDVGCSNPAIIFRVVVLPQPDGPNMAKNSPRPIEKSALSTATNVPYCLRT